MTTKKKLNMTEWDGNIFFVLGKTVSHLKSAGRKDLADTTPKKVLASKDYYEALRHCISALTEAGYEIGV